MGGTELPVLPGGNYDVDGGQTHLSGMRWHGKGMDPEVRKYFLDPFRMMATISLMTEEHRQSMRELEAQYEGRPKEYIAAASEYLVHAIGIERIEVRYHLMQEGEYPWPIAALLK
jgi:hypothetical protein